MPSTWWSFILVTIFFIQFEKKSNLLPDWLYDEALIKGETETISSSEEQFWSDLIEKYLKPLELSDDQKVMLKFQYYLNFLVDLFIFNS